MIEIEYQTEFWALPLSYIKEQNILSEALLIRIICIFQEIIASKTIKASLAYASMTVLDGLCNKKASNFL